MWFKRKKARFGPADPAANIEVLLEYLERSRTDQHFFRGQNRYFAHNAPSAVRAAARLDAATPKWVPLSDDHWARASSREQARFDLRVAAMRLWGPAVGNLLCQQYGITSDGYDITADPSIAAFFATRKYPHYRPLEAAENKDPGVIYRFTIEAQSSIDLDTADFTLSSYGYFDEPTGRWIYFSRPLNPHAAALYGARHPNAVLGENMISDVEPPLCRKSLMKVEACLRHDTIQTLFLENVKRRNLSSATDIVFGQTRIGRQAGAVYFPSFRHDALVSQAPDLHRIDKRRFIAPPGSAKFERTTHVQELHSFRTIEVFFFSHGCARSIERFGAPDLWPGTQTDRLYKSMCELANQHCTAHLDSLQVEPNDFSQGLIDPGYRP